VLPLLQTGIIDHALLIIITTYFGILNKLSDGIHPVWRKVLVHLWPR
jgi:hypothetical protein